MINLIGPKIAEARRRAPMLIGVYGASNAVIFRFFTRYFLLSTSQVGLYSI